MPLITFMSDHGLTDHYVAAVKARILVSAPTANIIDISHNIAPFNLPQAAFVLRSVFKDFPIGTIHLVSVNNPYRQKDRFVALKLEGHYFIGADSGIYSLISNAVPEEIVELSAEIQDHVFPSKLILAPAVVKLANGAELQALGEPVSELRQMLHRQLRVTKTQLIGHVVHIDHYGNLVTNISKKDFEEIHRGRPFAISFARESLNEILNAYFQVDSGDCVAVFNSEDLLEIAINNGNASELLGMHFDSPVMIHFQGE